VPQLRPVAAALPTALTHTLGAGLHLAQPQTLTALNSQGALEGGKETLRLVMDDGTRHV
jgi:hypothetical protein